MEENDEGESSDEGDYDLRQRDNHVHGARSGAGHREPGTISDAVCTVALTVPLKATYSRSASSYATRPRAAAEAAPGEHHSCELPLMQVWRLWPPFWSLQLLDRN